MKIAFYTLGCKVNQYESQAMSEFMSDNGYNVVPANEKADIYVINSCTVTAESDRKTRQTVRRFKRNNPDSIIVLTGCMPQAFPKDAEILEQADIVMGNKNNHRLLELIEKYKASKERIICIEEHKTGDKFCGNIISGFDRRTRAIVKIEDGCNRFCSYCIIPYARGRVRSKPIDELKTELENLSNAGFSEIVLVGINLSAYGTDIGLSICDAVELAAQMSFSRIRLGSLEPDHITDEVINRLSKIEKFCPQFHISLQSGCDNTLKAMNRHYTSAQYKELCLKLRNAFDDTTITTDIMVGFPTESEDDFKCSVEFAKKIGFEKVHVFPYSPREGTKAASMIQLERSLKERRSRMMIEETEKIRTVFLENQIGKKTDVLFETRKSDGYIEGYTKNYTPVKVKAELTCGEIRNVEIIGVDGDFCIGKITE
ncbi:MAG: tRNA (N(6)-L-threonylcarbamoyladenosine(37)-C(2))-methylthiotransferase MtaB [Ruminococcus sp.]|nr:tRNA (N(6)-L-threonylcarbamoyladenosine(37)-C(2))-methylthiotransferase MtaB [Candidatus Copronaster equi]